MRTILPQMRRLSGIFDANIASNEQIYPSASEMAKFLEWFNTAHAMFRLFLLLG